MCRRIVFGRVRSGLDLNCGIVHRDICKEMRNRFDMYCSRAHRNFCVKMRSELDSYYGTVHRNNCVEAVDKLATQKVATQKSVLDFRNCTLFLMGGTSACRWLERDG